MSVQNISNIIYDIKEKITDGEYKNILDELMMINKQLFSKDEMNFSNKFFKQFFYHNHQNNKCFKYQYIQHDNSILLFHDFMTTRLCQGDDFIFEEIYNSFNNTVEIIKAKILKISPRYTILQINNFQKKVSNLTLCKVVFHHYITIE